MAKEPAPVCLYTEASADAPATAPLAQKAVATASDTHQDTLVRPVAAGSMDDAAARRERERDCFRDAEARVRRKLTQLQAAVRTTLRSIEQQSSPSAP